MERSSPLSIQLKIQIQNQSKKYKCSGCSKSILQLYLADILFHFLWLVPELWHFPQSLWLSEPNTEISYKLSENHIKMSKIGEFQDSRQIPATPNPTVLIYLRPFQSNILFENSQNQIESVWNISMIFARKKSSTFLFRTFWITFERMKWALSLMGSHVEEQIFIFPPDGKVYNVKFYNVWNNWQRMWVGSPEPHRACLNILGKRRMK